MTATPDLESLVAGCAAGDHAALRQLYEVSAAPLLGIATGLLGRRDLAERVLVEAFADVWEHASRFDPSLETARAWLVAIVRYRALDALDVVEPGDRPATNGELSAAMLEQLKDLEGVGPFFRCLEHLTAELQRCLLMAYGDGCTYAELGDRLARPVGTVRSWTRRGLMALRACLEP